MAADVELLPCPFCGGQVFMHHGHRDIGFVACGQRDDGSDGCGVVASFRPNKGGREAIAAWNRRATAAKDAEIEALRAEVEMLRDAFSDDDMTAGAHWFGRYVEQKRHAERLAEALHKLAAHIRPTCSVLWDEAQAALHPTAAQEKGDG